ncbi:putative N-acetyltransferase 16 isoform X2 [Branchiostoma floridae x Branchiostoma japonicum]
MRSTLGLLLTYFLYRVANPAEKMAVTSGDLSYRLACHGDYDAVMRISEGIYDGTDYLPAFFHSYIDDPDVTVFLAVTGDQVVGLRACRFTERGTVFLVKAARVAPDWRGQGVDRKLSLYQEEWVRRNRPAVKYKRSVMGDVPHAMIESAKKKMRPSSGTSADPVSGGDRTLLSWMDWTPPACRMSCLYRTQTTTSVPLYEHVFLRKLVAATRVNP